MKRRRFSAPWPRLEVWLIALWLLRAYATIHFGDPLGSPDTNRNYAPMAHNLWAGRGLTSDRWPPYVPTAWRTPGYIIFLALTFSPWPHHPELGLILPILLEGLSFLFFYKCLRAVSPQEGSAWPARLGAALLILWPYNIYYNGIFIREPIFIPLLIFAYGCFLRAVYEKDLRWFARSGVFLSLSIYFREDGLHYLILVTAAWLFAFRKQAAFALRGICQVGCLFVVLLSPWVIRNYVVFDRFILTQPTPAATLWILGNVEGWWPKTEGQENLLPVLSAEDQVGLRKSYDEMYDIWTHNIHPSRFEQIEPIYRGYMLRYIKAYPWRYARLSAKHFVRFVCSSRLDDFVGHPSSRLAWALSLLFHSALYILGTVGLWRTGALRGLAAIVWYPAVAASLLGNIKGRYELPIFPLLFLGVVLLCFSISVSDKKKPWLQPIS